MSVEAHQVLRVLLQEKAAVWCEGDTLHVEGAPLWLVPLLREYKAEIIAILDDIEEEGEERLAIMTEAEQELFDDLGEIASVPGFDDLEPISDAERLLMNLRLLKGGRS